jgi:anhydro-N-acetylmuramic acid kinase
MDRGGRLAARGRVNPQLLAELLAHPFLRRRPPKSTGREEFGETILAPVLRAGRQRRIPTADLLATCTLFTALAVASACRWVKGPVDEVIVGGGGVRNRTLMGDLAAAFEPAPVRTFDEVGWDSKAFEAVAFAVLAYQTIHGEPANVPAATGARRLVVLGGIIPGKEGGRWIP